jgi:hypothetical protein
MVTMKIYAKNVDDALKEAYKKTRNINSDAYNMVVKNVKLFRPSKSSDGMNTYSAVFTKRKR